MDSAHAPVPVDAPATRDVTEADVSATGSSSKGGSRILLAVAGLTVASAVTVIGGWHFTNSTTSDAQNAASAQVSTSAPAAANPSFLAGQSTPSSARPSQTGTTDRWNAVHGPGCREEWFYADPGWQPTGAADKQDGCAGTALFLQVGNVPDHFNQMVNWLFDTWPGARCAVEVFIPDDRRSAGTAFYYLDDNDTDPPYPAGPITVDQAAHRGTWIPLGTWSVPGPGRLSLILGNQPGKATDTYTVTASTSKVTCHRIG